MGEAVRQVGKITPREVGGGSARSGARTRAARPCGARPLIGTSNGVGGPGPIQLVPTCSHFGHRSGDPCITSAFGTALDQDLSQHDKARCPRRIALPRGCFLASLANECGLGVATGTGSILGLGRQPTARRKASSGVERVPLIPVRDLCSPSCGAHLGPGRTCASGTFTGASRACRRPSSCVRAMRDRCVSCSTGCSGAIAAVRGERDPAQLSDETRLETAVLFR